MQLFFGVFFFRGKFKWNYPHCFVWFLICNGKIDSTSIFVLSNVRYGVQCSMTHIFGIQLTINFDDWNKMGLICFSFKNAKSKNDNQIETRVKQSVFFLCSNEFFRSLIWIHCVHCTIVRPSLMRQDSMPYGFLH